MPSAFIQAHLDSMVACDFFTKPISTPLGKREGYALMFIHLATSKVYCSFLTYHPDGGGLVMSKNERPV